MTAHHSDDDELDAALEMMDIDKDFNVWSSFRQSLEACGSGICGGMMQVADQDNEASSIHEELEEGTKRVAASGGAAADGRRKDFSSKAHSGRDYGAAVLGPPSSPGRPPSSAVGPERPLPRKSDLTPDERDDLRKWNARFRQEQIYSKYYRPVPREQREMQELAAFLGVPKNAPSGGGMGGGMNKMKEMISSNLKQKGELDSTTTASSDSPARKQATAAIFFPTDDDPKSILLKRGPVLLRNSGAPRPGQQVGGGERELILLTRGFVVAAVSQNQGQQQQNQQQRASLQDEVPPSPHGKLTPTSPSVKKFMGGIPGKIPNAAANLGKTIVPAPLQKKLIRRKFENCYALADVTSVEDLALTDPSGGAVSGGHSFAVTVHEDNGPERRLVFTCGKQEQKAAWIEALEIAVIQAHVLAEHDSGEVGWQHDVLRTSIYSAAIRNDDGMMRKALMSAARVKSTDVVNTLDSFGGRTALHYATGRDNMKTMEMLLKAGANANALDKDGRDPMYYAERSKFLKAADLLETYGGSKSPERDGPSELFDAAAETIKKSVMVPSAAFGSSAETGTGTGTKTTTSKSKRAAEAEEKSKGAMGAMADAMSALRERGERLESLDKKTADLQNDASEYRDLARQLKEKTKKQGVFGF